MENLRGAALMTLAMLGFAVEDMLLKLMAGTLPPWQIIGMLGAGGAIVFAGLVRMRAEPLFPRACLHRAVILRNIGELLGTLGYMMAIVLIPLSTASAVLQATPLAVTLGAAVFLGEPVGWRRWSAITVGFLGVLLVIRPGGEGFDIKVLLAVLGVIGLSIRDLATRRAPVGMTSFQLGFLAFLTLIPAAAILAGTSDLPAVLPGERDWFLLLSAIGIGSVSYYAIVGATRLGDVSYVTPFRYTRIVFALILGALVFGERPDALMLAGILVIVGSGIYTVWRERKLTIAT